MYTTNVNYMVINACYGTDFHEQKTKCNLWNGPVHGLSDDLVRRSVHISGVDDTVSCGISRLNTPKQTMPMHFDTRAWEDDRY